MSGFVEWVQSVVQHLGYTEIFFLMALESSLFPVPSELVMIPAGFRAAQGDLNPWLATLTGGLGSLLGASANYLLGRYVGRAFLLRYGKWFLINEAKYHEAEALFLKNAKLATFVGRFIPVIRHLISLPAGVFGMALLPFALLTTLGATLWCGVLVLLGYYLGEPTIRLVAEYSHLFGYAAVALTALFGLWFLLRRPRR
ncbi:DedA family protein [Stagnimonas aquatica]|uniref:DedA family protein n=1 Tax=Stagnimonas aquatica TaxID=2689987 RepID=A0A3N0VEI9_9GAMM|nr:DedA family protein [Stagnimonas aquatica]ROH91136.1 DedA family protein [Stagnimonas aquatica]